MRWFTLGLFTLVAVLGSQLAANDGEEISSEMFADEEDFLSLEGEIDALLEEEVFDDGAIETEIGMEDYDQLEQVAPPSKEQKQAATYIHAKVDQIEVPSYKEESLPIEVDKSLAEEETMVIGSSNPLQVMQEETKKSIEKIEINLRQVFAGSPIIYLLLFLLSTVSVCVWLYSMFTIRSFEFLPPKLIKDLRSKLISNQYDEALDLCVNQKHFFCKMLASGILARKHGLNVMIDTMKSEGKRSTVAFWQRISILNEIAIIAPMLGLLGTVLGMFYAFYDLNRSVESVSLLFDGLGVSVGTTVAGLIVAILAMILYSVAKYRLVRILANVENEAQNFAALIDTRGPNYFEK